MQPKTVSYSKVFSLGNYENEKIGVEIEMQPGDDPQTAIQQARNFVEFNHRVNGLISRKDEAERIINNPGDFTGNQIDRARKVLDQIDLELNEGKRLLTATIEDGTKIKMLPFLLMKKGKESIRALEDAQELAWWTPTHTAIALNFFQIIPGNQQTFIQSTAGKTIDLAIGWTAKKYGE